MSEEAFGDKLLEKLKTTFPNNEVLKAKYENMARERIEQLMTEFDNWKKIKEIKDEKRTYMDMFKEVYPNTKTKGYKGQWYVTHRLNKKDDEYLRRAKGKKTIVKRVFFKETGPYIVFRRKEKLKKTDNVVIPLRYSEVKEGRPTRQSMIRKVQAMKNYEERMKDKEFKDKWENQWAEASTIQLRSRDGKKNAKAKQRKEKPPVVLRRSERRPGNNQEPAPNVRRSGRGK